MEVYIWVKLIFHSATCSDRSHFCT